MLERVPAERAVSTTSSRKPVLGRLGSLAVCIAGSASEVEAALRLRYEVFSAARNRLPCSTGRDEDRFDRHCRHLIVVDEAARQKGGLPAVVATYRLLDQQAAIGAGGFYSQAEFDIAGLVSRKPDLRFIEFGRSCVAEGYRDQRTVELLWHGSWAHVRHGGYDVMFGCASFEGTDPRAHAGALSLLAARAGASQEWDVAARGEPVAITSLAPEHGRAGSGARESMRTLPPIIRGYLRLGAMFATEASIDREFGTLDVLVLLPVANLNPRYLRYYGMEASRHAAG